jgi:hypothetical protein
VDTYQSFGGQTPGWYPVCGTSAVPGYDLASGVGTVNAASFVPQLAYLGRHS